jgi:hypothetical protein
MAKLRVNWAPDKLLTLDEVLGRPGYYFNAISGDIFRHEGHSETTERTAPEVERAEEAGIQPQEVESRIWLFLTDDLDLTEGDVRGLLRDGFNVRMADMGRLVSRVR